MSGIGTKNIQGNFKSMDIKPGNVVAKVNAIRMDKVKYPTNTPEFVIYLDLETKPIGNGFEGFAINKDKPELGKYKGQFKTITNTRWSIKDFTTRDGKKIDVTKQVLKFVGQLLNECNSDWLDKVDGKFERIERGSVLPVGVCLWLLLWPDTSHLRRNLRAMGFSIR